MKEKFLLLKSWLNNNSWFVQFIWLMIGYLLLFLPNKIFGIALIVIILFFWLWYFFKDHIKEKNKIIIIITTIFAIITLLFMWINKLFFSNFKILKMVNWYDLKFEDTFKWWNFSSNENFIWIKKDDQFTNWIWDTITLTDSSLKARWYSIYQDLKKYSWEKILITKVYLPNWTRAWIQLVNTIKYDSNDILNNYYEECRIHSFNWKFNWDNFKEWYWACTYKNNGCQKVDKFTNIQISPWIYYILAKISWDKLSCYFQREWEKDYKTIIENKKIDFQNLWWPMISRIRDWKDFFPKILDFKLYIK
jgi:hypothetical protein